MKTVELYETQLSAVQANAIVNAVVSEDDLVLGWLDGGESRSCQTTSQMARQNW